MKFFVINLRACIPQTDYDRTIYETDQVAAEEKYEEVKGTCLRGDPVTISLTEVNLVDGKLVEGGFCLYDESNDGEEWDSESDDEE